MADIDTRVFIALSILGPQTILTLVLKHEYKIEMLPKSDTWELLQGGTCIAPLQPGWPTTYPSVVMMASDTITRSWVRTSASFTARLGFIIRGQKAENVLFMYLM